VKIKLVQLSLSKGIDRDFKAQTMAIFTPDQQKVYQVNLAIQSEFAADNSHR
jgi:hypothetical protein